ncbi:Os05g0583600 [Oryza sativa Japonica Group]|uniref:Os05g0583600 protein n=2 Tax=Oryza sativa subsp. japonica TaxID=39947 RepID=B7F1P6_ORYSJ|nr:unknow protein [Oryza sativa Japonica Group]BAG98543.1 unnamed protein product [Oryza sativa Japonica Group]BAH93273.1 Os05g0583600 [Oryza sativa Japonica Group]|eukprot:NP_001174545.1 Os05g0583600 [Oryza sativa Japonica Group]
MSPWRPGTPPRRAKHRLPPPPTTPISRGPRSMAVSGVGAGAARGLLFTSPSTAPAPPAPALSAPRSCHLRCAGQGREGCHQEQGSRWEAAVAVVQLLVLHRHRRRAPAVQQQRRGGRRGGGDEVVDALLLPQHLLRLHLRFLQQHRRRVKAPPQEPTSPRASPRAAERRQCRRREAARRQQGRREESRRQARRRRRRRGRGGQHGGGEAVAQPVRRLPELDGGDGGGAAHLWRRRHGRPPDVVPVAQLKAPPPGHPRRLRGRLGSRLRHALIDRSIDRSPSL